MTAEAGEISFFEGQIIGAEAPRNLHDLEAFQDVDGLAEMQWNDGMATARADVESASLEEAFDGLGVERAERAESETLGTGVDSLDEALDGGLRSGLLTELAEKGASSGGQVLLLHLLAGMRRAMRFAALVDGADGFDPQSSPPELLCLPG